MPPAAGGVKPASAASSSSPGPAGRYGAAVNSVAPAKDTAGRSNQATGQLPSPEKSHAAVAGQQRPGEPQQRQLGKHVGAENSDDSLDLGDDEDVAAVSFADDEVF